MDQRGYLPKPAPDSHHSHAQLGLDRDIIPTDPFVPELCIKWFMFLTIAMCRHATHGLWSHSNALTQGGNFPPSQKIHSSPLLISFLDQALTLVIDEFRITDDPKSFLQRGTAFGFLHSL